MRKPTLVKGTKFGDLTVVDWCDEKEMWLCKCLCGKTTYAKAYDLTHERKMGCGCRREAFLRAKMIPVGSIFGKLTVLEYVSGKKYKCLCDCGNITYACNSGLKTGHRKSCGCISHIPKLKNDMAIKRRIFRTYRRAAKDRGFAFDIQFDRFCAMINQSCQYCGSAPYIKIKTSSNTIFRYNGIDRVDSKQGYVDGNIVTCCVVCNKSKNAYTLNDWKEWIKRIYNNMFVVKNPPIDICNDYVI